MKYVFQYIALFVSLLVLTSMDKPKLKKNHITDGISIKVPTSFIAMSDQDIAVKYPSTKKPLAMYTSMDRMVDFGLNVTKSRWAGRDMNLLKDIYKSTLYTLYNEVNMIQEEVKEINNQYFIVLEFTSKADGTRKYTYLQYGIFNNRVYILNFTCPEKMMADWQETAGMMMESVKVKPSKLKAIDYNPKGDNEKGKSPKEVLEHQKKKVNQTKTSSTPGK